MMLTINKEDNIPNIAPITVKRVFNDSPTVGVILTTAKMTAKFGASMRLAKGWIKTKVELMTQAIFVLYKLKMQFFLFDK